MLKIEVAGWGKPDYFSGLAELNGCETSLIRRWLEAGAIEQRIRNLSEASRCLNEQAVPVRAEG